MNFLLADNYIKREIIFLLSSIAYIIFYVFYEIFHLFHRVKKLVKPERKLLDSEELKNAIEEKLEKIDNESASKELIREPEIEVNQVTDKEEIQDNIEQEQVKAEDIQNELTKSQKDEISEIARVATTKMNRGEYSESKAKIIEGLSIDKFNKQLNLLLASLYEKDKDYKKAELIYKDLIVLNDHDIEVYLKLGYILSLQNKFEVAFEIYKKIFSLDKTNIESIDMLANISHHLEKYEDSKEYSKILLKKNPRNVDILYLQAVNMVNLQERKDALEMFLKLKQIEPYNVKVNELIEKIKLEIELETNFRK